MLANARQFLLRGVIMPVLELMTGSGLGSLLGMRHALEPDHLAAVSTLVSRERSGIRAALLGVCWGLGHTVSLVVVGALLVALRAEMPPAVSDLFELLVAFMLVALGFRAIVHAARQGAEGPTRVHRHGRLVHSHAGVPAHVHIGVWTLARRPLLIGVVHGLAGSGALTALVLDPVLNERIPEYTKTFRIVQPVTLDPAVKSGDDLPISGVLSYQACDDKLCYPPATASVTWTVKVK